VRNNKHIVGATTITLPGGDHDKWLTVAAQTRAPAFAKKMVSFRTDSDKTA
jgi:hypothetical protein